MSNISPNYISMMIPTIFKVIKKIVKAQEAICNHKRLVVFALL